MSTPVTYDALHDVHSSCSSLAKRLVSLVPGWERTALPSDHDGDASSEMVAGLPIRDATGQQVWDDDVTRLHDSFRDESRLRNEISKLFKGLESSRRDKTLSNLCKDLEIGVKKSKAELERLSDEESKLGKQSKKHSEEHEHVHVQVWDEEMRICNTLQRFHGSIASQMRKMLKKTRPGMYDEDQSRKKWKVS